MKQGCIFLLFVWAAAGAVYYYLFQGTGFEDEIWLPIVLGLAIAILAANLLNILMVFQHIRASKLSPSDWKDGTLIAISGRLQTPSRPLEAPFSGRQAMIIEYQVSRLVRRGKSTSNEIDLTGLLMLPCSVVTMRGNLKLVGFPFLAQIKEEKFLEQSHYERAGRYLAKVTFKEQPINPFSMISELEKILGSEDGVVDVHFKSKDTLIPVGQSGEYMYDSDPKIEEGSTFSTNQERFSRKQDDSDKAKQITASLRDLGFTLSERIIPFGSEVTIFGTYLASKQQVDVGSGIKKPKHQIHLGPIGQVLGQKLRKGIAYLVVWAAVCAASNWYVAKLIGFELSL